MEEDAILCTCRVALATQARPPMGGSLSLYVQTPMCRHPLFLSAAYMYVCMCRHPLFCR